MATKLATKSTKIIIGPTLGDPEGMRPSIRRYYEGSVGVHKLTDGREAHVTWLYHTRTHVNVVVWVPGTDITEITQNVVRVQAAGVTERLLELIES